MGGALAHLGPHGIICNSAVSPTGGSGGKGKGGVTFSTNSKLRKVVRHSKSLKKPRFIQAVTNSGDRRTVAFRWLLRILEAAAAEAKTSRECVRGRGGGFSRGGEKRTNKPSRGNKMNKKKVSRKENSRAYIPARRSLPCIVLIGGRPLSHLQLSLFEESELLPRNEQRTVFR